MHAASNSAVCANTIFGWPDLKQGVGEFLELQGVPPAQAERFSQQIIAQCADHAESIGIDRMDQRVLSEAQTLVEGWFATRRDDP